MVLNWKQVMASVAGAVIAALALSAATSVVLPINGGTGVAGTITGIPYANGTSAYTAATTAQVVA